MEFGEESPKSVFWRATGAVLEVGQLGFVYRFFVCF